jgi:hypothetical protein
MKFFEYLSLISVCVDRNFLCVQKFLELSLKHSSVWSKKRNRRETIVLTNVDIKEINFSQSTIQDTFKDGKKIVDVIQSIKSGQGTITDIPTIKVVNYNGVFYSLDNERSLKREAESESKNKCPICGIERSD